MAGFVFVDADRWRVYIEHINNATQQRTEIIMNVNISKSKFISEKLFNEVVADIEREIYVVGSEIHDTQERVIDGVPVVMKSCDNAAAQYRCAFVRFKEACWEIGLEPPYVAYGDNFFEDNYRGSWVEVYKAWILVNSMK